MNYRTEIDGLRALAVVPVIFFHAGFESFSGGFVGVDVFFVITGYLITTIIIKDIETNRFSLINFYERRARRILPALTLMVFVSIAIGWYILTPYFYRDLFQTTAAISFFSSNILLYMKSGYFSATAELKPFLHTWSLAVEEQYYLVFPVILFAFWRFGRQKTLWLIITLAIFSLLLSTWQSEQNTSANFYLLPSRAWEILAGSIAAIILHRDGQKSNNLFALIGLIMIVFSVFAYDRSTPFPSFYALAPVIGTFIIIVFGGHDTIVARLLSIKIMVGIGLISYSLYLWHQPVFAFLRHAFLAEPSILQYLNAIIFTFFVAFLSWRYIEKPLRNKKIASQKIIFISSGIAITCMAVLGFFGNLSMGFINRLDQKTQTIAQGSFDRSPLQAEWNPSRLNCPNESCLIGVKNKKKPKYALIGNSHADHLAHSLNRELISRGLTAYTFAFNGCQPVDFDEKSSHFTNNECFEKILKFLNEEKQVKTIIVSFRWTSAITGIGFGDENKKPVTNLDLNIIQERGSIIARKIEELVGDYRNLLLVYPIPEPGKDVPNYIAKYRMLKDKNFELTIPVDVFQRRNIATYTALDSISSPSRIVRIYPSKVFCDENSNGICRTVIKGKSLYFDDNHLSTFGASLIAPVITAELPIR